MVRRCMPRNGMPSSSIFSAWMTSPQYFQIALHQCCCNPCQSHGAQVYAAEGNAVIQHLSSLDDITASYSQVPSLAEPMEALPSRPQPPAAAAAAAPAVALPAGLTEEPEDMDQSERNIAGETALRHEADPSDRGCSACLSHLSLFSICPWFGHDLT